MGKTKKKTRSQIGRASRRKGKTFEQVVAREIREMLNDIGLSGVAEHVKRGWQTREGHDAPDIDGTGFWIETKHHARVNVQKAVKQAFEARNAAKSDRAPLLVAKDTSKGEPIAVMGWADFLAMWKRLERAENSLSNAANALAEKVVQMREVPRTLGPEKQYDTPETVAVKAKDARGVLDAFNAVFHPAQPPMKVNGKSGPIDFGSKDDPGVEENDEAL